MIAAFMAFAAAAAPAPATGPQGPSLGMVRCALGVPGRPPVREDNVAFLFSRRFEDMPKSESATYDVRETADPDRLLGGMPLVHASFHVNGQIALYSDVAGARERWLLVLVPNPKFQLYEAGLGQGKPDAAPRYYGICGTLQMPNAEYEFHAHLPKASVHP